MSYYESYMLVWGKSRLDLTKHVTNPMYKCLTDTFRHSASLIVLKNLLKSQCVILHLTLSTTFSWTQ